MSIKKIKKLIKEIEEKIEELDSKTKEISDRVYYGTIDDFYGAKSKLEKIQDRLIDLTGELAIIEYKYRVEEIKKKLKD